MTRTGGYSLTPPLPAELQVEVTGSCNLRCRMCLVRYAPAVGRAEGALSYEDFRDLVDGLPELTRLTLQGLGEPLLAPHLLDMVRHATTRGVEVGFNTNGVLLDRRWARDLVAAGTGWVHVSLDGATAATYEDVRHGGAFEPRPGQFDRVVANLRALLAERAAAGAARPVVKLVFVAMRRNIAELPDLVALAADLGVDELWVQNLSHSFSDTDPAGQYAAIRRYAARESLETDPALFRGSFDAAAAVAAARGVPLRLPRLAEHVPADPDRPGCTWPWQSAYVTHRGEVQPCCMVMGSDRATLGRLGAGSFADIWHGEAYRAFRAGLRDHRPADVCRGCAMYRGVF
ncbi:radical SAM protein [Saccharothrix obliqua]|uniref:radical SAM protein n=1 Tax=Saccharothrix obliqua TaxID=2861747 RepID=UPI001C5F2691|nr:radical SAM protein [Saccharothrix obliqua]MBW4718672.1 SPASM domain-containing protein [Saccharothrix obliqua]